MHARKKSNQPPPVVVIFGDEEFQKQQTLQHRLDELLPPEVDRTFALAQYDGDAPEDQGGPTFSAVADDLATAPFLADRRVVVIRAADKFVSAAREQLEKLVQHAPPTGILILECRSFPKTTRLYKQVNAQGGELIECKQLAGRAAADFVQAAARERGKQLEPAAAAQLVSLLGQDAGLLTHEVEKLSLFVGDRSQITRDDVRALVGQSREEKIFAVMDAAGLGNLPQALDLWQQVLSTDSAAVYRAVGGVAYVLRRWLAAQRMLSEGMNAAAIAPKVMMYGRVRELETILRRLPADRLATLLAALATLDAQAKTGRRSIEQGIEGLLVQVATAA